jgi:hypothetical protein
MSEENKNEKIIPAVLQQEEPLISKETAESFQAFIDESLTEKYAEAVKEAEKAAELVAEPENVITNKVQNSVVGDGTVQGITAVENGVIGTGKVAKKPNTSAKKEETKVEKVAIHSSKNVTWSGVGKVYRGYNLVTPEQAEKWLTRNHTRLATPQEVAQEFDK